MKEVTTHILRASSRPRVPPPQREIDIDLEAENRTLRDQNEDLRRKIQQLQSREDRFRILVSGVKDYAIFMLDPEGNILSWNEGAERVEGYTADEIIGKNFSIFYTKADRERKHPEYELEIAKKTGKYEEEGLRVRKDGSTFEANVLITALYNENGELRGFGKVTRDITERKRAHAELERRVEEATRTIKQREAHLRLITDSLPTLICYISPERRYTFNNAAYTRWFGRPAKDFTGQPIASMVGHEVYEKFRPYLDRAFEGKITSVESDLPFPAESSRFIHATYIPDVDSSGVIHGVIALTEDITERKRAEEEQKRSNQHLAKLNSELSSSNAELSQFAHISSHDLKEPLRMVKTYTQLIASRYKDILDENGKQYMEFIVDGASRMDALINDLLAYSAVGRANAPLGEADLASAAAIAMSSLREAIRVENAEVTIEDLPYVRGNESQLAQVLQNLIGNAVKFHGADVPRVKVSAEARGNEWLVSVADNGIGIEPQYLEKVFIIFQRLSTKTPGTGIGLAICKRIVERHGGKIWATSKPGKGTTFFFTLPRLSPQALP